MAKRRKPSDIYNHISPLDHPRTRRPRHAWVRDRRERMEMARNSETMRRLVLAGWKKGTYDDRADRLDAQHGKDRATCIAEWAVATVRAEELIQRMIEEEILDLSEVTVPGSDEELAKQGLTELAKMALGPVDKRTKLYALDKLLSYVKAKPAQKIDAKIGSVEEWLTSITKDSE